MAAWNPICLGHNASFGPQQRVPANAVKDLNLGGLTDLSKPTAWPKLVATPAQFPDIDKDAAGGGGSKTTCEDEVKAYQLSTETILMPCDVAAEDAVIALDSGFSHFDMNYWNDTIANKFYAYLDQGKIGFQGGLSIDHGIYMNLADSNDERPFLNITLMEKRTATDTWSVLGAYSLDIFKEDGTCAISLDALDKKFIYITTIDGTDESYSMIKSGYAELYNATCTISMDTTSSTISVVETASGSYGSLVPGYLGLYDSDNEQTQISGGSISGDTDFGGTLGQKTFYWCKMKGKTKEGEDFELGFLGTQDVEIGGGGEGDCDTDFNAKDIFARTFYAPCSGASQLILGTPGGNPYFWMQNAAGTVSMMMDTTDGTVYIHETTGNQVDMTPHSISVKDVGTATVYVGTSAMQGSVTRTDKLIVPYATDPAGLANPSAATVNIVLAANSDNRLKLGAYDYIDPTGQHLYSKWK